jgi:uncharacterized membrane protein
MDHMRIYAGVHIVLAVTALLAGLLVTLARKGTPLHRRTGWMYAGSLAGMNLSALLVYRLTGHFGPFHVAALLSLVTILLGIQFPWRRKPVGRWVQHHAYWMGGSYVGLLAAAAAEVTTRVPQTSFWWTTAGTSAVVTAIGIRVLLSRIPPLVKQFERQGADARAPVNG